MRKTHKKKKNAKEKEKTRNKTLVVYRWFYWVILGFIVKSKLLIAFKQFFNVEI